MATMNSRLLAERSAGAAEATGGSPTPWRTVARAGAIFTLIGSAIIHFSQVRIHLQEWGPAGATFLVLAGAELVLAATILVAASRPAYLVGIWVSQATILLWLLSRTVGIPFGPEAFVPEPIGKPDLTATTLEAITMVALFPLFLSRPSGNVQLHLSSRAYLAVGVLALLVASSTWFAMLPPGGCDGHRASESRTGPLVPIDGHSILGANTPVAEAIAGQQVGLVVGLLHNCGSSTLTIRSGRLAGAPKFEMAGRSVSFWVVPPSLAQPGRPIPADLLRRRGTPLPGEVPIEPAKESRRYPALVLLVHATRAGDFWVNAVEITYAVEGRVIRFPYATAARLRIS
ncbi:MAG: hypothetical protein ACRDHO_00740 [Actinomycetota bacterium]